MLTMTKDEVLEHDDSSLADGTILMSLPLMPPMDTGESGVSGMKSLEDDLDEMVKEEDDVDVNHMLSVVNAGGNLIRTNHATLQSLLSTPISTAQMFTHQDGIQVITIPTASDFLNMGLTNDLDRLVHMVPTSTDLNSLGTKYIGLIAISNPNLLPNGKDMGYSGFEMVQAAEAAEINAAASESMAAILMPPPQAPSDLLINCPSWALRLKKCEKIGDSYRGYVENETDLDVVLTLHKQQTNSFWGTRQSPSPAKASTRLMWKSQYVPFDGIPFVNAGSRAVVMECQYGPRRKGTLGKRGTASNVSNEFKQTCPARIYIKKVRKFPSHAVNLNLDKKTIRLAMDKAFHELREQGLENWGEERYYVQLPTDKAHDYHDESSSSKHDSAAASLEETIKEEQHSPSDRASEARIHPAVLEKIRQMVATGETRLYSIRKQLRKFVVRELFLGSGVVPERHDLTMFPTVNDLKNHIHQALKDIESGVLALSAPVVNLEVLPGSDSNSEEQDLSNDIKTEQLCSMWSGTNLSANGPLPETVTVTLTQNPDEDGHHIISRIETHLSDGTTQVSTSLTPETAQLLSRLHPGLFPVGSLLRLDTSQDHSPKSECLSSPSGASESTQDLSSENPVSGLDSSVHGISVMDPAHLSGMVDMDSSHNISDMMDSDSVIHLNTSQNISALMDSSNLASMVNGDSHHLTMSSSQLLSAVDSATISEMVSSGQLTIVSGLSNTLHLVANKPDADSSMGLDSSDSDSNHMTLVEEDSCDGQHDKLSDKINLHITSDQEMGMARLENKVSDL
ncbi:calcium-responsive transcription factor-like isoform X2 [Physella acuta]|nr:calcium-responsive transcription factor-like isoform X2 [Physella acuta]XP_059157502.1 calcium-responsive transcription factor-like isoform X2 [Physella acuta]